MRTLDITLTDDLVEALCRAAVMGHRHGEENKAEVGTDELRRACGVTRWMGGATAQFSDHLRALKSAYRAAWHNGSGSHHVK